MSVVTNEGLKPRSTPLGKRIRARWQLYLFLLVPFTLLVIFEYLPMGGLQLAFKDYKVRLGIWGSPWADPFFKYFDRFFSSFKFVAVLKNTLLLSFYGLVAGFPLPIVFALFLNALPSVRYRKVVQTVTYIPHFISTVVMVGIIMQVFNTRIGIYGVVYQLFANHAAPDLLGSPEAFRHINVWSGVWQSLGWNSIIYMAALTSVDQELHEAAQIDGASRFKRLLYIDLPTILPTASILLIMSVGSIMNVGFEKIYLMQNDMNISASEVISTYVYKVGMVTGGGNYSAGTAIGLFNSGINFFLLVTVNYASRKLGGSSLW